jgi:hypothetical protein
MVELEQLNQYRFYTLEPKFPSRCDNTVDNIYSKVHQASPPTQTCGGLLNLHMTDGSVNMRCPHVGCFKQYEIPRICSACGKETTFEDITCDICEPRVINIATWNISIAEANKAIKKVNRAFKQNLIDEKEWKTVLHINQDEIQRCEKLLEKV